MGGNINKFIPQLGRPWHRFQRLFHFSPRATTITTVRKMSEKALGKGSQCPPLNEGQLRLYGMRFCPYVKRVRLVLADKKIQFQTVNINLSDKPEWYLKRFPEGNVPVLERDGKIVQESLIIADYLDDITPDDKLHPSDPYKKAVDRLLVSTFSNKVSNNFYKAALDPTKTKEAIQEVTVGLDAFEQELICRKTKFFGGNRVRMLDLMIWPFFEMLQCGDHFIGPGYGYDDLFPKSTFSHLREWMKNMSNYPAVKQLLNIENLKLFADSMRSGNRNYDVGL